MSRVALLGYGRFGRALGELLQEGGHAVRGVDPHVEIPQQIRADSLDELVADADFVIVAVPVSEMRKAIESLLSHLKEDQVVLDVGSVKGGPYSVMEELLGNRIPWVATHPLFGPISLALGEQPLVVVLCASPAHPDAARRVRNLYEGIGCRVVEQEADAHDRWMAETHALAFFIAKGLIDMGVTADPALAPPSVRALLRIIETVRADAGHLISALHRENPHSGRARERFLRALTRLDQLLDEGEPDSIPAGQQARTVDLPGSSTDVPGLVETRELIDEVDRELVSLLGRRARLALRAGRSKAAMGLPVLDAEREAALLAERQEWGRKLGLGGELVGRLFEEILRCSRQLQEEQLLRKNSP
ncbi:MAG: prephenate dehydrogenase/arogenate dehydrogenase family protein [Bradymonadales bacterium]|nr:prephenate dehydrogenase/arogenate dehydrogenase family protein [Bradymonadales bacterium]